MAHRTPSPRPMPSIGDLPRISHRMLETERLRMHVAEVGSGPPVLLLRGWPQHWYAWRHLIPLLADRYRLICPDLRGFGWTEATETGYRTSDLVDDVIGLLDALELDNVLVVGHGEGARVAFHLGLRRPDRVRRLVALNQPAPFGGSRRAFLRHAWRYLWTPLVETTLLGRWVVRHLPLLTRTILRRTAAPTLEPSQAIEEFVAAVREPQRARASERLMHEFAYHELIPTLRGHYRDRRLTVPTLVLAGAEDPLLPPALIEEGLEYADDLRLDVVPHAGHYLHEEAPQVVADAIGDFFLPAWREARVAAS
jgi:pimeloyl-ACP methyl ester carboxylesterase